MISQAILTRLKGVSGLSGVRIGIGIPEVEAGDTGTIDLFVDVPIAEDDTSIRYADGTITVYANTENRFAQLSKAVYDTIHNKAIATENIIRMRVIDSSTSLETDSLYQTVLSLEIMTRG